MQAKMITSRAHALRMLNNDVREYGQWFPAKYNLIADALSRDFHLDNSQLQNLFSSRFKSHIHKTFKIVQLSDMIDCWICAWL